jgi:hypothetical protein
MRVDRSCNDPLVKTEATRPCIIRGLWLISLESTKYRSPFCFCSDATNFSVVSCQRL